MPLRNSLHRRNHKERAQPAHRSRLGLLEKHTDYLARARDYRSKRDRIARLRQKAAAKNRDEFYFSMTHERTTGGVHTKDRGNAALPTDYVKLLKTQDENYVRTIRMSNIKKIDKIKMQLAEMADLFTSDLDDGEYKILQDAGLLSQPKQRKAAHILFATCLDHAQALRSSHRMEVEAPKQILGSQEDLGWKQTTSRKKSRAFPAHEGPEEDDLSTAKDIQLSAVERRRQLSKELGARLHRDLQLRYAQREFELQRLMMGKGANRKIAATERAEADEDSEEHQDAVDARKGRTRERPQMVDEATYKPRVYKWKLERKR